MLVVWSFDSLLFGISLIDLVSKQSYKYACCVVLDSLLFGISLLLDFFQQANV